MMLISRVSHAGSDAVRGTTEDSAWPATGGLAAWLPGAWENEYRCHTQL